MSFDKIKIISTRLKYGVSPSPADEVEQHVTIWSNGEVKISRYVFGDIRSGYVKAWSDTFYITKPDVENIFEHISMYFAENYEKKKKKDNPGCWEMTVTMEDGMRKKIRGHLCHDEYEAGDIDSAASSEKRWRGHIRSGFSMAVWRKEGAGMSFA